MTINTKFFFLSFAFCLLLFVPTKAIDLSDSSRITLLTCSPGEELYSAFGHNGIRVTDFKNDFDVVFNYGTFDFAQPGFYTNFLKGKMRYMVSTDRYYDFIYQYTYEKRSVIEQELNLNTEDKVKIFAFLYNNALPQNREYYYDFFWDNCATRIRDVFENILGNRIQYHTENAGFEKDKTMHDMLRVYVGNRPWVDYGFDLILGMPCEVAATPRSQTFLPDYLAEYFESATLDGKPLVIKKDILLQFPPPVIKVPFRPIYLSLLLVFIGMALWFIEIKKKKHYFSFDFILFFSVGLLGSLFLSLWLFSSHYSVPENLNLFWLIPSHLIVSFFLLKKKKAEWMKYYFGITALVMIVLLLGWKWIPQHYNIAAMPLVFLLFLRSSSIALYLHSQRKQ